MNAKSALIVAAIAIVLAGVIVLPAQSAEACCKGAGKSSVRSGSTTRPSTKSHSSVRASRSSGASRSTRPARISKPKAVRSSASKYRASNGRAKTSSTQSYKFVTPGERHVSQSVKNEVYRRAGVRPGTPGYVVDHRVPLALGGSNDIGNLQLQTVLAAKAKDGWELRGSHLSRPHGLPHRG